jgi:hypothetical protein
MDAMADMRKDSSEYIQLRVLFIITSYLIFNPYFNPNDIENP